MDLVRRFRKDPSPLVRDVATHIEHEIVEIESIERWVDRVTEERLPNVDATSCEGGWRCAGSADGTERTGTRSFGTEPLATLL